MSNFLALTYCSSCFNTRLTFTRDQNNLQFMIAHKVIQCPSGTCVCDTLPLQLYIYIYIYLSIYLLSFYLSFPPLIISTISINSNPLDGESLEGRASVLNPPDLAGLLCRSCSSFRAGPRVIITMFAS